MNLNKKASELPINIVVMLIIGIIIFGLGMSLFSKFASSGEEQIEELNNKIKTGISQLECENDISWVCVPTYKMKNGENQDFYAYITNQGQESGRYFLEFTKLVEIDSGKYGVSKECGSILIQYPNIDVNIQSAESAQIPFKVIASRVKSTPCNFVTTVSLKNNEDNTFEETSPVIIRVE